MVLLAAPFHLFRWSGREMPELHSDGVSGQTLKDRGPGSPALTFTSLLLISNLLPGAIAVRHLKDQRARVALFLSIRCLCLCTTGSDRHYNSRHFSRL